MPPEFDGPHFAPGLIGPNGRLAYFAKGGSNSAALQEQRLAREQSAAQFAQQMAFAEKQFKASQEIKTPTYNPPAPPASGSVDVVSAGQDMRRNQRRRFGVGKTTFAGESRSVRPVLGGAVALAA